MVCVTEGKEVLCCAAEGRKFARYEVHSAFALPLSKWERLMDMEIKES